MCVLTTPHLSCSVSLVRQLDQWINAETGRKLLHGPLQLFVNCNTHPGLCLDWQRSVYLARALKVCGLVQRIWPITSALLQSVYAIGCLSPVTTSLVQSNTLDGTNHKCGLQCIHTTRSIHWPSYLKVNLPAVVFINLQRNNSMSTAFDMCCMGSHL